MPETLELVTSPALSGAVGTSAGVFSVRVLDARGAPVAGVVAAFSVTSGAGRVAPSADTTDVSGVVSTSVTLGTMPGATEVSATVAGVPPLRVRSDAIAGQTRSLTLNQRVVRIAWDDNGIVVTATTRDSVANVTSEPVTWTVRDPTLVTVSPQQNGVGVVNAVRRPGTTYVVAQSGVALDSLRVAVQDSASSPCDFVTAPRTIPVGGAIAMEDVFTCLHADVPNAEFALVAHYNTALNYVASRVTIAAFDITARAGIAGLRAARSLATGDAQQVFEAALRERERAAMPERVAGAREWRETASRRTMSAMASSFGVPGSVRVGDMVSLNVNATDFCANASLIDARVMAVTNGAIVLADTANPEGGFSSEEYFAFGVAMDTLIHPVDTAAFGAPDDIDENGRIVMLFTKAVNQLTPRGSTAGVVLGFFYGRDLLPRVSGTGECRGSNVSEMFYLLAPDPGGRYSDPRTKADVARNTLSTIAHEYQHLINTSRRLYVTHASQVNEEVWLNEGLSHIAEELVFYRASGFSPRRNIDGSQLQLGSTTRELFDQYLTGNFRRYRLYAIAPDANSPLAGDALLSTRGATWSFLRYLADRAGATDGDLWRRLVNANLVGVPNLDAALAPSGMATRAALSDWSIAVLTDDGIATANPAFQQPSWHYPSVMPATGISPSYPLTPRELENAAPLNVVLQAGGNAYFAFGVAEGRDALLQTFGAGNLIPAGMRLTLIRIK